MFLPQIRMDLATIEGRVHAAEEAGFGSVWLMDHLAPPAAVEHPSFEGWTLASVLVARTERIHVGHLVLADPFRHPALLAKMASTLDVLSGGRFELGIGWGSVPLELTMYGVTEAGSAERAARMGETLEVLELLFTGGPVSYHGRFHHLDGAYCLPRPVAGRIPIHIGGAGPKLTMPLVARHADWWNCPSYAADRLGRTPPRRARPGLDEPGRRAGADPAALDGVVALTERRFADVGRTDRGNPRRGRQLVCAADLAQGVESGDRAVHATSARPRRSGCSPDEVMPAMPALAQALTSAGRVCQTPRTSRATEDT